MESRGLVSLLALSLLTGVSANTNDTNSTSDGLSGGAIAGIIVGVVAVVAIIGFAVYWFYFRGAAEAPAEPSATASYGARAGQSDQRNLPMMALRVSGHDDDL